MTTATPTQLDVGRLEIAPLSVEDFLTELLQIAAGLPASDLHFHEAEDATIVSVRHLGVVRRLGEMTHEEGARARTFLKITAGMDATRSPLPLDGRIEVPLHDGRRLDVRISTIPTLFGEDMALRLLERGAARLELGNLGFHPKNLYHLTALINKPGGLILLTGPTETGKTTTLYACLQRLNDGARKINTIEDPIEYTLPGIHQSQVNPKRKLDFSELLRGVLRQAPDVIMVGEIRDAETAQTVVQAANSGQLVFATCHAPTAAGAVASMLGLGVEPQFLASSLIGVVAQRLVRVLCPSCKRREESSTASPAFHSVRPWLRPGEGKTVFSPVGCERCHGTGYADRSAAIEVLRATPSIHEMITSRAPVSEMRKKAIEQGMLELRQSMLLKAAEGLTSLDEVYRNAPVEPMTAIDEDDADNASFNAGDRVQETPQETLPPQPTEV